MSIFGEESVKAAAQAIYDEVACEHDDTVTALFPIREQVDHGK